MDRLRKFMALPRDERHMLLAALGGLPIIIAGVRLLGYKRVHRLLSVPRTAIPQPSNSRRTDADRIAAMVQLAARHGLVRGNCLSRSLLLWRMLQRRRIPAEIRFGVRSDVAGMQAHAWVEQDGRALEDEFDDGVFADLQPARRKDAITRTRT